MKITVKRVNGKAIDLNVETTDKIADVKAKLHEIEGTVPERQLVIFEKNSTHDNTTLSEYNIQDGSVLFMMPRVVPRGIEVTIKTLTGKAITLHAQRSEPVINLKSKLRDKEGIPTEQQRLIFSGKELEDDYTIGQYNMEDKCVLHLVVRLPRSTCSTSTSASSTTVAGTCEASVCALPNLGPCEVPGACGLQNFGNTCYMNSTLQALSNLVPLMEYFSSGAFKQECSSSPLSMNGRLAECFADLLKSMWSGENSALSPHKLKHLVAEKRPEFSGYHQHDAQEFLTFFLDGLHEDVNRAAYPRLVVSEPTTDGKTDEQIAAEAWSVNLLRNNSTIVEIFQFQVRSEIQFPDVDDKSLKFDPMMYLSLPLPKPTHRTQLTVLTLRYPDVPPMKHIFQVSEDSNFGDLEGQLAEVVPPPADLFGSRPRFVFATVSDYCTKRILSSENRIRDVHADEDIWAFEVSLDPELTDVKCDFVVVHTRRRPPGAIDASHLCSPLAPPFVLAYKAGSTSNEEVMKRIRPFADRVSKRLNGGDRPLDSYLTIAPMQSSEEGRLITSMGQFSASNGEAISLNFVVPTELTLPESGCPVTLEMGQPRAGTKETPVRLEQCLEAFTRCEELAQEDWATCARTQEFERSLKKLDLWSAPRCLVVHLKRFGSEQLTGPIEKVETFVDAPIDLDLSRWLKGPPPECGAKYKLFAVVNHAGSLTSGHYTAYARVRAGSSTQWHFFNDATVTHAEERDVISQAAYILFYERCDVSLREVSTHT